MPLMQSNFQMQFLTSAKELSNQSYNSGWNSLSKQWQCWGKGFYFRCHKGRLYVEQSHLASSGVRQGDTLFLRGEREARNLSGLCCFVNGIKYCTNYQMLTEAVGLGETAKVVRDVREC